MTANLWQSADGAPVDLRLVNYEADLAKGVRRGQKPARVTVDLPDGLVFDCARLLTFAGGPQDIPFERRGNRVTVAVPAFGSYAVVSFADRAKQAVANEAAKQRRAEDRELVKRLAREKDLY